MTITVAPTKSVNYLLPIVLPVWMRGSRHQRVTAGVLDERSENAFTRGQCFSIAYALMESLNEEDRARHTVSFITQVNRAGATHMKSGEFFIHAYLVDDDGIKFDIMGIESEEEYIESWSSKYSDDTEFRIERATWDEVRNWEGNHIAQIINGVPKQRINAARSFTAAIWDRVQLQAITLGGHNRVWWE